MTSVPSPYSGQAIGILGLSYSGSTVLNYVLGSHTRIYGGSELIRLISGEHKPCCAVCGTVCPYWTPENLNLMFAGGRNKLYCNVGMLFGKPIVCDSSKQIRHFIQVMEEDRETTLHLIALSKHPIRHIASFVTNELFKRSKIITTEEIADFRTSHQNEMLQFATRTAENILKFYDRLDLLKTTKLKECRIISLKYESVISNPADALSPLLAALGLSYQDQMDNFSAMEHHPIGGNMGPHVQTAVRHAAGIPWGDVVEYRKQFYINSQDLKLDNKYKQTFSDELICKIEQIDIIQQLIARLGYSPLSTMA